MNVDNPLFSSKDEYFMKLAFEQAKISFNRGDLPVGAVLTIDGNFIGEMSNSNTTTKTWAGHAELMLINKYGKSIREAVKLGKKIDLYTTLEPCIMCFGACVMNRISTIHYACPDPNGGACDIDKLALKTGYHQRWPLSKSGLLSEEAFDLLVEFMRTHSNWSDVLAEFEKMGRPQTLAESSQKL